MQNHRAPAGKSLVAGAAARSLGGMPIRLIAWVGPVLGLVVGLGIPGRGGAAERLRLATYNVENYLLASSDSRPAKSEPSKAKVAEVLKAVGADVVALQELGGEEALVDLQRRLARLGLEYPHRDWMMGADTNIQVGLLSRFPIVARRPHVKDSFLLSGRRFRVSRGILEADIQVRPGYQLTVFTAHLKSRRTVPEADEAEIRREEARLLRRKVDERLKERPAANVVVLGDLNDTKDSESVRFLIGRGRDQLVDTRPGERNGDTGFTPNPRWQPRTVTWTHYYGVEDTYSRIDYILLHPNAAREWVREESFLPSLPDWGLASDHRPVVITLVAEDRRP